MLPFHLNNYQIDDDFFDPNYETNNKNNGSIDDYNNLNHFFNNYENLFISSYFNYNVNNLWWWAHNRILANSFDANRLKNNACN